MFKKDFLGVALLFLAFLIEMFLGFGFIYSGVVVVKNSPPSFLLAIFGLLIFIIGVIVIFIFGFIIGREIFSHFKNRSLPEKR